MELHDVASRQWQNWHLVDLFIKNDDICSYRCLNYKGCCEVTEILYLAHTNCNKHPEDLNTLSI